MYTEIYSDDPFSPPPRHLAQRPWLILCHDLLTRPPAFAVVSLLITLRHSRTQEHLPIYLQDCPSSCEIVNLVRSLIYPPCFRPYQEYFERLPAHARHATIRVLVDCLPSITRKAMESGAELYAVDGTLGSMLNLIVIFVILTGSTPWLQSELF